jgi:hypothetical protein
MRWGGRQIGRRGAASDTVSGVPYPAPLMALDRPCGRRDRWGMQGNRKSRAAGKYEQPLVVCVDVGSIRRGRFAWACDDGEVSDSDSKCIKALVDCLKATLSAGRSVALGFEAPLSFPDHDKPRLLGKARPEDGARPWSAGAGATVLPTALAQLRWILRELKKTLENERVPIPVTFTASDLRSPKPVLMIWEAMVTGDAKRGKKTERTDDADAHFYDARCAANAFARSLRTGDLPPPELKRVSLAGMLVDALKLPGQPELAWIGPPIVKPPDRA